MACCRSRRAAAERSGVVVVAPGRGGVGWSCWGSGRGGGGIRKLLAACGGGGAGRRRPAPLHAGGQCFARTAVTAVSGAGSRAAAGRGVVSRADVLVGRRA